MDFHLIEKYFLLFVIYSFIGWCMETTNVSIRNKKIVDRGFLIGPYCPIYGFGALLIVIVLGRFEYSPLLLFLMAITLCGFLEYITSWAMEKLFKARWWDYSNRKVNLNGRICLENLIAFGILGLVVIYVFNPFFINWIDSFSTKQLDIFSSVIGIIYFVDVIVSFIVIYGFRTVTEKINLERKEDNTEEITKMVRKLLFEKSFLHRRLINAYPTLETIKIKMKKIKTKIEDTTNEVRNTVAERTEEIKINAEQRREKIKIYLNKKQSASDRFRGRVRNLFQKKGINLRRNNMPQIKKGENDK